MTTYDVVSHGQAFSFDNAKWSKEFTDYLVNQALKVILDRSSASLTKKAGHKDTDRLEACRTVAERLKKGELPSRVGGSRLTDEDYSLRMVLNTELSANKGETVEAQLKRWTYALAVRQGKEFNDNMVVKAKMAIEQSELYKLTLRQRQAAKNDANDLEIDL